MEKGRIMKISAISMATFGSNKSRVMKQAAIAATGVVAGAGADEFVKGISKPDSKVEDFVKAYDSMGADNDICFDYSDCADD